MVKRIKRIFKNVLGSFGYTVLPIPDTKKNSIDEKSQIATYISRIREKYSSIEVIKDEGKDSDIISINGITMNIQTLEEYYILNEIYYEDCYAIVPPLNTIVIDIGLNVGIASLYFSKLSQVDKIYAFEPVEETYIQAQNNINKNPSLEGKITTFNYGLGSKNEKRTFTFNPNYKGSVGLVHSSNINDDGGSNVTVEVDIKNTTEILKPILNKYKEQHIVLKLDCEGGEYDIIEDLANSNTLSDFNTIILEWHKEGSKKIVDTLVKHNFTIHHRSQSDLLGLIYAFKS